MAWWFDQDNQSIIERRDSFTPFLITSWSFSSSRLISSFAIRFLHFCNREDRAHISTSSSFYNSIRKSHLLEKHPDSVVIPCKCNPIKERREKCRWKSAEFEQNGREIWSLQKKEKSQESIKNSKQKSSRVLIFIPEVVDSIIRKTDKRREDWSLQNYIFEIRSLQSSKIKFTSETRNIQTDASLLFIVTWMHRGKRRKKSDLIVRLFAFLFVWFVLFCWHLLCRRWQYKDYDCHERSNSQEGDATEWWSWWHTEEQQPLLPYPTIESVFLELQCRSRPSIFCHWQQSIYSYHLYRSNSILWVSYFCVHILSQCFFVFLHQASEVSRRVYHQSRCLCINTKKQGDNSDDQLSFTTNGAFLFWSEYPLTGPSVFPFVCWVWCPLSGTFEEVIINFYASHVSWATLGFYKKKVNKTKVWGSKRDLLWLLKKMDSKNLLSNSLLLFILMEKGRRVE